jgi:gluconolactonase
MVRRRALSAVERHPEQPHPALGRTQRHGDAVSPAFEQRQWHTRDREGRLVTCEHLTRRVTRTEYDGSITVLADRYNGKRLNSPNDVIVKSDGSIWFTDPTFGIDGLYEGEQQESELPACVYRVDGQSGEVTMVMTMCSGPNGLAFSPDESMLYIVESRSEPRKIRAFDVSGNTLSNNRVLIDAGPGTPDGFRVDIHGNLWCGWGMGTDELDGVRIFTPQGEAIGHIALPERCANRVLWRCASQSFVHGGEPRVVFAVREHAGREGG